MANKQEKALTDTKLTPEKIKELAYTKFCKLGLSAPSSRFISKKVNEEIFSLIPRDVKTYLDKYVISQDQAKKDIAVAVAYHYSRISNKTLANKKNVKKNNILMIGPTGVGKTYILQILSKILKVPFIEVDITKYTQTGYVGNSIDDLLKYVLTQSGENLEQAQKAIVYLDESDKLQEQKSASEGKDINGYAIQTELLKILEGTTVPLSYQQRSKIISMDTRNILFVCSGAFPKLEDIVKTVLTGQKTIGFSSPSSVNYKDTELLLKAPKEKLVEGIIKYGFLPEFIGRLPVITVLSPLTQKELKRILVESEDSIINHYKDELKSHEIELEFTDEALDLIAEKAGCYKTGARALHTVCEDLLQDYKYELPSLKIKKVTITGAVVKSPKEELRRMIENNGQK
ncbi:MAG: AAA family ATPase [archaeon]